MAREPHRPHGHGEDSSTEQPAETGTAAERRAAAREGRAGETPEQQQSQPQFGVLTEGPHSAEFILSEANSMRSRDNAYIADPATVLVGSPLKFVSGATTDRPATYSLATVGADCHALAIYAGKTIPVDGLRISIISRDAEVNGRLINWGAMSTAEQINGVNTLATKGIVVRV